MNFTENSTAWLSTSNFTDDMVNGSSNGFDGYTETPANISRATNNNLKTMAMVTGLIISPTLTIAGLFGNILTVIIMAKKKFQKLNSRFLLTSLAVSDSVYLIVQLFNKSTMREALGMDIRALSDVGCKFFFWACKTAKMSSSWLIVVICIERFIAVWFPLKAKVICTKRMTMLSLIAIYVGCGIMNALSIPSSNIVRDICSPSASIDGNQQWDRVVLLCSIAVYAIIPMTILIVLTPLVIYKLFDRPILQAQQVNSQAVERYRATSMLIVIVVAYIILVLPISILHLLANFQGLLVFIHKGLAFSIYREVAVILELLNHAGNFILYIITSSQFRQGLVELMTCK